MKRALISLVIGGTVFGGIYGLAASLGVSSDSLGSGSVAIAACQAGTVNVGYTPSYATSGTAGYKATTVTLSGLDTAASACGAKEARVTLSGASNASLGEQTGTTPSTGTTMSFTFTNVDASAVTGAHVTITG